MTASPPAPDRPPFSRPCRTRAFGRIALPVLLALACPGAGSAAPGAAAASAAPSRPGGIDPHVALADLLARAAPKADRKVLDLAARALSCARRHSDRLPASSTLSVIDYSRPSTEPRLWVFDLASHRLMYEEWVAHGRNTGENLATRFSNREGSYMSSLGGFETEDAYVGANGYSLRLRGLEPGFNDRARERAIVIHGAPYVSAALIAAQGRLGRSLGCPAVRSAVARQLIDTIRGGSFVFAYYPDDDWLQRSQLLDDACGGGTLAARGHGR